MGEHIGVIRFINQDKRLPVTIAAYWVLLLAAPTVSSQQDVTTTLCTTDWRYDASSLWNMHLLHWTSQHAQH